MNNPGDVLAHVEFERDGKTESISIVQQSDGVSLIHDDGGEYPPYKSDHLGGSALAMTLATMTGVPENVRAELFEQMRGKA